MTTKIKIEFDSKDASPLEVINTLNFVMLQKIEKSAIEDYAISLIVDNPDRENEHVLETLVAKGVDQNGDHTES